MKISTIVGVVVAVVVVGGAWYWFMGRPAEVQDNLGTYPYTCDNGAAFTMTPASDVSSIALTPGAGATFGAVTLAQASSTAGARYEGGGVVFVGAGEGVTLSVAGATFNCSPVPNPDSAPFNWGDAGEGGGVKQDVTLIVSESIVGNWKSVDDATFTREFKAGGAVDDLSNGKVVSTGSWKVFTKANAPADFAYPIADDAVYVQMTMQGTQTDTLNFKVAKLTPESLQMVYLDRGGVLNFSRAQ